MSDWIRKMYIMIALVLAFVIGMFASDSNGDYTFIILFMILTFITNVGVDYIIKKEKKSTD